MRKKTSKKLSQLKKERTELIKFKNGIEKQIKNLSNSKARAESKLEKMDDMIYNLD